MATDKKALKKYIDEQDKWHNELTTANNGAKAKIMTYIGVILGLLVFLYSSALDAKKDYLERLFIPDELYGRIFYSVGLFLLLFALGKLIHGARPNGEWHVGYKSSDSKRVEGMSEEEYLIKLKNDNDKARECNMNAYNKRWTTIKDSFYPMLIGAIIMVVLRYFQ